MKTRKIINLLILLIFAGFVASCDYAYVEPIVPEPLPPGDTISFSTDIIPIWNNGNNCTSCHGTGGTPPDLTSVNAFNSLNALSLIDLSTPENSIIYNFPAPSSSTHTWKKYTANEAAKVLRWIEQGAQNN